MRPTNLTLEDALDGCMGRYRFSGAHMVPVSVTLDDYPQCRGEGNSLADALRDARSQFSVIQDCRGSWVVGELLQGPSGAPPSRGP